MTEGNFSSIRLHIENKQKALKEYMLTGGGGGGACRERVHSGYYQCKSQHLQAVFLK